LAGLYSVRCNTIFPRRKRRYSKNEKGENIMKGIKIVDGEIDKAHEKY
jgi:hypothetical protein